MNVRHPKIIGFGQYAVFPLLAVFTELIGYATGRPVPVSAFAGLYPISLVLLSIYPPLISNRALVNPSLDVVQFARGAYLAALGIFALALLFFAIAFAYGQPLVALGILLVGTGSLWLPIASAGAGYGNMLAASERGWEDFLAQLQQRHLFETIATSYLGLYLRKYQLLRREKRASSAMFSSLILSPLGWLVLGIAGGYPLVLFGIVAFFLYLIVVGLELRTWVPIEKRQQISDLIARSTSPF